MLKLIIKISALTATLLFSGCGGSSGSSENELATKSSVSKDAKILAKSILYQDNINELTLNSNNTQKNTRAVEEEPSKFTDTQECINGGTMSIESDNPYQFIDENSTSNDLQNFTNITKMSFNNCIEDGTTTNGILQMSSTINNNSYITTIKYLTDFTEVDSEYNFKIYKDSYITMIMNDTDKMIVTESINAVANNEEYHTKDLKVAITINDEIGSFYFISGEELIDGKKYKVDESYDASITPFIENEDGFKKGGKAKFIGENSHITIEATADNEITISEDIDNDGKIDNKEIIKF